MTKSLYPDIVRARGSAPPSVYADEARRWIAAEPHRWTPERGEGDPSDVLAVIGALVLSAAVRQPLGWDGAALRGPIDPVQLIADAEYTAGVLKGAERLIVRYRAAPVVSLLPHQGSKYWAGQITVDRIWKTCHRALAALLALAAARAEEAGPDQSPPRVVGMDARIDADSLADLADAGIARSADLLPISVTGYDAAVVNIPIRDGFSIADHPEIRMTGQRPAVELYGLIGAAWVETQGRWVTPHCPSIPAIAGIPLRDRLDLDRLILTGEPLRCAGHMTGSRSYLR